MTETQGLRLELDTVLDAPRDAVFRMLTEPAGLARWWGPAGFTTPEIALDLRPGGTYRLTMQPPTGEPFHLAGEFLEVDSPRRLVSTFRWEEPTPDDRETVVAIDLEDRGSATRLTLSQGTFATPERLELHRGGWTESFEKLRAALASPAA
ncbi:SRPBCC family protein [Georgenia thermotolerans]|uniref:SRPBCC domain-containing protein n=1 Tax=Georgenia thermotolerans TaxID=527326 RepID=A0A7J5URS6_9MICO|nr:SRPBCC domain-containing protein [Georgenia thermotolerans]KAE8765145.1 SRPBCC domain-containing protein [Georgenia thermotolerans]